MAALCNRPGHIYFHPVVCSSFFLSSFFRSLPNLSRCRLMSTILTQMVWPYCEFKMQVWNMLRGACCKYRTQIVVKKPTGHHRTTLSGYIFATKARIENWKKLVKQQYLLHMFPQYGELRPTSSWDPSGSLGHPCKFQWVSRLGSITAQHSNIGRQPNFVALNRRRHLYSAGRHHWALAHILVHNEFH